MSSENSKKEVPVFKIDDSTSIQDFDFGRLHHYSASASSILTQTPSFA